jgi:succinoglycan biosynthesis transport protein ExoP
LQRYMASVQQESFPVSEVRLIASAAPPTSKSKPTTPLILALALMGGMGLGVGAGLLRDLMDRVFRTSDQLQELLQTPCLALVPLLKEPESNRRAREQTPSPNLSDQRTISRSTGVHWKTVDCPLSPFAESIRSIKLATNLYITGTPNKVIGFTSSLPNEGKSTISAALGLLAAHAGGGRVLVVDCDLRNPTLSNSLAPDATVGIVDVITGAVSFEEAMWKDSTSNLYFLPTIKNKHLFHTSELLGSESTRKLFDKLRSSFDYIVVDLPPLAPVIDARAAASILDCMILVVEWGQTKIDVVQHALNTAPNVREILIGAVLNKTNMDHIKRYDLRRSDIYNNNYYGRYSS